MKIIGIVNCAAGNSEVGTMWTETKIFEDSETLADVFKWYESLPSGRGGLSLSKPQEIKITEKDK